MTAPSTHLDDARETLIRQVADLLFPAPLLLDPRAEWTPEQATALEHGGLTLRPLDLSDASNPLARSIASYSVLIADSLTLETTAALLHVSASRVRQRLGEHSLYGIKWEGRWRLPRFQFDRGAPLPGLERVLPALDPGLSPVAVERWFTTPDPDLPVDDQPASPREWLAAGQAPVTAAALGAALGHGL